MTLRVTDQGFSPAPLQVATPLLTATSEDQVLLLANSDDPALAVPFFTHVTEIKITFPSFSDGRGFTLARLLRNLGYEGRLIAKGHVLADQYAMARRVGFDGVDIASDLAARQSQSQWLGRANWEENHYQARLR